MPITHDSYGNAIHTRRARQTGATVRVEPCSPWYPQVGAWRTVCETHDESHDHFNCQAAHRASRTPAEWCSVCARLVQDGRRISGGTTRRVNRRPSVSRNATGRRLGSARRFGVEIEFFGVARDRIQRAINDGTIPNGWRVKADPSVRGMGLELVSPPLSGDAGLDSVRTALRVLRDMGARVDRTCGLHVHHDVADMNAAAIRRFARNYAANQHLLDWLVSSSRRTGTLGGPTYCRSLTDADLRTLDQARGRYDFGRISRYRSINVGAYPKHGTVEIRQHQGTLNFVKVSTWIKLGQAIADTAAALPDAIGDQGTLRELFQRVEVDGDTAAYFSGRALQLGASVGVVA